jgi:hypothetical protein
LDEDTGGAENEGAVRVCLRSVWVLLVVRDGPGTAWFTRSKFALN